SQLRMFGNIQTISIFTSPFEGEGAVLKRIEDIILGLFFTLLSLPVMLFVAIGIKLTSPGPVLFKQNRYGLNGKQIQVWKFRTMRVMENSAVVTQATRNDPRITKFGAFLRKTSLDELPQFINVLQGRMSIVGPRPHAVAHNEQYRV
ncbi:sugar transferase, partial [Staphylococcus aureus]